MGAFIKKWERASDDLGLSIKVPYEVFLGPGEIIKAQLLVENFGAPNGMLILTDYKAIEPFVEKVQKLGYGFSIFQDSENELYDKGDYISLLCDWGWSGNPYGTPEWMEHRDIS